MTHLWSPKLLCLVIVCVAQTCISECSSKANKNDPKSVGYHGDRLKIGGECNSLQSSNHIIILSLMNGDLAGINVKSGEKLWSVNTGGKLVHSSISSLEVIYNGIPTKIVPSLDGSLFRFHDDMFEPLPFTADTLLSSSFKLTNDATIVGSKELLTVGIDPYCGQVFYRCDKLGCASSDIHDMHKKDVLVAKHLTQTIRATSVRHGIEKWNFSVGSHDVKFVESSLPKPGDSTSSVGTCDGRSGGFCSGGRADSLGSLRFSVADGKVIRMKHAGSAVFDWMTEFSAPIAKAWYIQDDELEAIDLLDPKHLILQQVISTDKKHSEPESSVPPAPPSLFIGVFEDQVYIQTSAKLQEQISGIADKFRQGVRIFDNVPRVRWAPYLSSSPSRTPWLNYGKADPVKSPPDTALSVFHPTMDYPYDNGFYLTTELPEDLLDAQPNASTMGDVSKHNQGVFNDIESTLGVQIVSLSYYWKEVLIISIIVGVIMNATIWATRAQRRRWKQKLLSSSGICLEEMSNSGSGDGEMDPVKAQPISPSQSEPSTPPVAEKSAVLTQPAYISRYQSDFKHVQCLGKGGFGVVFHAQNLLDECEYAIKRITLPNSDAAKEKVTREVKALAKLDHPNIVRYFQSWFETPPVGWQEDQDKALEATERFMMPTPINSFDPLFKTNSYVDVKRPKSRKEDSAFVPKFRLDEFTETMSFGPGSNGRGDDDPFDIVFSEELSKTTEMSSTKRLQRQPFVQYTIANTSSDQSDEEVDLRHLDDSGYHKNWVPTVGSTHSFELEDSVDWDAVDSEEEMKATTVTKSKSKSATPHTPNVDINGKLFLYIQMQLCKRETLKEYLMANTLHRNPSELLLIFRQICDAVQYIHSQGLIHRDLKPTNIFFSLENTIKVGDFGLVTALSTFPEGQAIKTSDAGYLTPGILLTENVGTQLYMSPEQMAGKKYNNKVDIYALGLIFFEMKYPFSTVMERIITLQDLRKNKLPERFERELPDEAKFVLWMLTRNPNKRPSITEVINAEIMSSTNELLTEKHRSRTISCSSGSSPE